MENNDFTVNRFKIIPGGINKFKYLIKNYPSLRFTKEPSYEEDYITISFSVDGEEYSHLLDECIDEGIYYYAQP